MAKRTVKISQIKQCAKLQCTYREAAAFLGIRVNTFKDLLASDPKVKRAWEEGQQLGLMSLRRKQFRLSGQNATMAIFLGKQYLKQRDTQTLEHTGQDGEPLDLSGMSKEDREALRALLTKGDVKESDTE